jgi:tripartite-type tricarboxylate transporter receptor subunit TctC
LKLQREIALVLKDPPIAKQMAADGGQAVGSTPEEFAAFFKADIDKWDKLGRKLDIPKE